jgi:hypothetical protein
MEEVKPNYHINMVSHQYLITTLLAKKSIKTLDNNFLELLLLLGKITILGSSKTMEDNTVRAKTSRCSILAKWA